MKKIKHYIEALRRLYRNTNTTIETLNALTRQIAQQDEQLKIISDDLRAMKEQRDYMFYALYKEHDESTSDAKRRFFLNLPEAEGEMALKQQCVKILMSEFGKLCDEHGIQYWINKGTLLGAVRHNGFIPWDDDADVGMMRAEINKLREAIQFSDTLTLLDFISVYNNHVVHNYRIGFKHYKNPCFIDIFIHDYIDKHELTNDQIWDIYIRYRTSLCSKGDKLWTADDRNNSPFKNEPNSAVRQTVTSKEREAEIRALIDQTIKELGSELNVNDEYGSSIIWSVDNITTKKLQIFNYEWIFPLHRLEFEGREYLAPNNYETYLENWYGDIWSMPNDMITHKHLPHLSKDEIKGLREVITSYKDLI